MCPNRSLERGKKGFMKLDLYKRIIDEASDYAYDINVHHRGESLIHPDLFEMIKYANHKGLLTELHTNATLLTEERSYKTLESGLDLLSFSFDGYNKETYEKIRVNANFNETLNNIVRFLQIKKQLGKTKPYTRFEIMEVLGGEVEPSVKEELRGRFSSLPLDEISVKLPHNWAGNIKLEEKSEPFSPRSHQLGPCTFPWYALTIFWDGTVVPCPQDFFGKIELGNFNESTLREIWNGQEMISLRKRMVAGEHKDLKPCNTCDRILRRTILGSMIPRENILTFVSKSISGYGWKKKFGKLLGL